MRSSNVLRSSLASDELPVPVALDSPLLTFLAVIIAFQRLAKKKNLPKSKGESKYLSAKPNTCASSLLYFQLLLNEWWLTSKL